MHRGSRGAIDRGHDGKFTMLLTHAVLALSLAPSSFGQTSYLLTEIPVALSGGAINISGFTDDGTIAFTANGEAFLWSAAKGLRELVPLPGGDGARVTAIRANGEAVGYTVLPPLPFQATAWDIDGTPRPLRTPSGAVGTIAEDTNGKSQIIGSAPAALGVPSAVLWWQGVLSFLPKPAPYTVSLAYGVNDHGMIVGALGVSGSLDRPVIWLSPTQPHVPDLPPLATGGYLLDINNAQQAVGVAHHSLGYAPLRYDVTGLRMLDVSPFDIGSLLDLNRDGTAVGYAYLLATQESYGIVAFGDTIEAIRDLVDPVTGAGWNLPRLDRINNHGQITAIAERTVSPFGVAIVVLDPMP